MEPIVFRLGEDVRPEDQARTLASAIYGRLRAEILSCRLQPDEKLAIAPLGKRFKVSLASVREALSRLVADGLVVAEDQRGFRVSPLSLCDLEDLTRTRIEIECLALRRSIGNGGPEWEAALRAAWTVLASVPHVDPADPSRHSEAWTRAHGRFHEALVAGCGLTWMMRFRGVLYEQSERYRRLALASGMTSRDTAGEHRRIVEAALARDADTAAVELAEHFRRTADTVAAVYGARATPETTAA